MHRNHYISVCVHKLSSELSIMQLTQVQSIGYSSPRPWDKKFRSVVTRSSPSVDSVISQELTHVPHKGNIISILIIQTMTCSILSTSPKHPRKCKHRQFYGARIKSYSSICHTSSRACFTCLHTCLFSVVFKFATLCKQRAGIEVGLRELGPLLPSLPDPCLSKTNRVMPMTSCGKLSTNYLIVWSGHKNWG